MINCQLTKSSTSEIVDIQVVMYIICISTSLGVNEFTFLQFNVKSAWLMRLFADNLAYNLIL